MKIAYFITHIVLPVFEWCKYDVILYSLAQLREYNEVQ